jgi:hypothetical protein
MLALIAPIYLAQSRMTESPSTLNELDSAISYALKELDETLPGTSMACGLLSLLESAVQRKRLCMKDQSGDSLLQQAADYYIRSSKCIGAPMLFRIQAGTAAALCYADGNRWKDSARVYEEVINLLPLVAPQSIERYDLQDHLRDLGSLTSSASAVTLRAG